MGSFTFQSTVGIHAVVWASALLFPCSLLADNSDSGLPVPAEMPISTAEPAAIDQFIPVDEVVSNPSIPLPDPEFDEAGNWVTWQRGPSVRNNGLLLVARVDPDNGDILDPETGVSLPAGGRGKIIDTGLASVNLTRNGPEWALAVGGSRLLYTKLNENNEPSLAEAVFDGTSWVTQLLNYGRNRITPEGSKDKDDPEPRVAYYGFIVNGTDLEQRLAVRKIDFAYTEKIAPTVIYGATFIPNESAILGTVPVPGSVQQVAEWDYETDTVTQITFDLGAKKQTPEVWLAPELAGDAAFVEQDNLLSGEVARVYRRTVGTDGTLGWTPYFQFASPDPNKPYMRSLRPFVYQGKSYISFKVQPSVSGDLGSDFYITDLETDPRMRLIRKVSNDEIISRDDQEYFITNNGPIIYYSELTPEGIYVLHRMQTGL